MSSVAILTRIPGGIRIAPRGATCALYILLILAGNGIFRKSRKFMTLPNKIPAGGWKTIAKGLPVEQGSHRLLVLLYY